MINKKASLELSIRTIVIVILAMTLLGLGLGFVRSTFKDIRGISEDVTEQVRQQIIDDLITNDKKLSFTKTEVKIDRGSSEILTLGIRNKEDETLSYKMEFTSQSVPENVALNEPLNWLQYRKDIQELLSSEADVRSIRLDVPRDAKTGSYFLTFDANKFVGIQKDANGIPVLDENGNKIEIYEPYATKDLFIVVS
ncbi:MAG: hypothetical protein QGH34_03210 [Candidatus Woesearchaeota archaeon]|jgi:hypothetical protein|nr:hypothetical protein [Candidatus Woesearchaeota archaeon]|tara:strand:- start:3000 stop:3587 length:588 start_codon:yes stop_codon:yes gene_type:complete